MLLFLDHVLLTIDLCHYTKFDILVLPIIRSRIKNSSHKNTREIHNSFDFVKDKANL